jgi:V8-like Glu-specific endopeptidase
MNPDIAQLIMAVGRLEAGNITLLGTAFAVDKQRFATAAHVTGQNDLGLQVILPKIKNLTAYQDTTDAQVQTVPAKIVAYDPIRDISVLEVEGITCAFTYSLAGTDEAVPGTPITSVGFPHSDHGRLVLTQQTSSVGARVLLAAGPLKTKQIVMNVQTRPGQSGSPVFLDGTPRVCAMILGMGIGRSKGRVQQ